MGWHLRYFWRVTRTTGRPSPLSLAFFWGRGGDTPGDTWMMGSRGSWVDLPVQPTSTPFNPRSHSDRKFTPEKRAFRGWSRFREERFLRGTRGSKIWLPMACQSKSTPERSGNSCRRCSSCLTKPRLRQDYDAYLGKNPDSFLGALLFP